MFLLLASYRDLDSPFQILASYKRAFYIGDVAPIRGWSLFKELIEKSGAQ